MWPPTTSRILEPPNCLPANWEALWADKMQHKVIMFVLAQSESLKISQNWPNRENENYFGPGWREKVRPLPAPASPSLSSTNEKLAFSLAYLCHSKKDKTLYLLSISSYISYMDTHKYPVKWLSEVTVIHVELGSSSYKYKFRAALPLAILPQPCHYSSLTTVLPAPSSYYQFYSSIVLHLSTVLQSYISLQFYSSLLHYLSSSLSSHFALPSWPSTPPWTTSSPSSTNS